MTIVKIEEVGECVRRTLDDLNAKLWAMNQRGHNLKMPGSVDFKMTVLVQWEALESTDRETGKTTGHEGGNSTDTRKSANDDTTLNQEFSHKSGENSHLNQGQSVVTQYQDT